MADILELIHQLLTDGFTLASLISIILVWHKLVEGNRKREAYERLESKVDAILEKENIVWNANSNGTISFPKRLRNSIMCFLADILTAKSAVLYILLRRNNMQISRIWLAGFITQILGYIGLRFGLTFDNELADDLAGIIILFVIPTITAWINKMKAPKEVQNGVHTENNR